MSTSHASRALILAFAAALAACAPVAAPRGSLVTIAAAAPQAPAERRAPSGPDALIWIASEGGKHTTRWLAPAGAGYRQVAEAPELYLAAGAGVWRWSVREERVTTASCAETNGAPPGEGTGDRVVMEKVGSRERTEIVAPPAQEGVNEVLHGATPVGSIGPYLFVRESTYVYACGAHGFTSVSQDVWDLSGGRKVDLLAPDEVRALDAGARRSAQRLLSSGAEEEAPFDEIAYVASSPRYGARGWLGVEHAFTASACYACGDGAWSSYTRAVDVPAPELPARVRAYAHPPAVVAAYLGAHPDVKIAGWSELSPEAAVALGGFLHPLS